MGNSCAKNSVRDVEDLQNASEKVNKESSHSEIEKSVGKSKNGKNRKLKSSETREGDSDSIADDETRKKMCTSELREQLNTFKFGDSPTIDQYSQEDKMKDLKMLRKTFGQYYKELPLVKAVIETPTLKSKDRKRNKKKNKRGGLSPPKKKKKKNKTLKIKSNHNKSQRRN